MIRIIGKYFFIVCLLFYQFMFADVTLKLSTTDGNELDYVLAGQPFSIEVTIKDMPSTITEPKIFGSTNIELKLSGTYMSSINGKATKRYSYWVRIDEPGTFTIGPASVEHKGYSYQSQEETIEVVTQPLVSLSTYSKRNEKKREDVFLRLSTDVTEAYVGQRVKCSVRFYTSNEQADLHHLSPSVISGASMSDIRGPKQAVEEIDGKRYYYAEWSWDLYPNEPGKLVIPAYCADYQIKKTRGHGLSGFAQLFMSNHRDKRVYSNALTLDVDALPPIEEKVFAIGEFTSFTASLEPGVAKEGEGVLLSLELKGSGNWDHISSFALQNIPKTLKYYDSNVHFDEDERLGVGKNRFEFIVQGVESGNWQIPSQKLTYFNTNTGSYKTLETAPLEVTVTPNAQFAKQVTVFPTIPKKKLQKKEHDLFAVSVDQPFDSDKKDRAIGWVLFCLFVFFPLCGYLSVDFYKKRFIVSSVYQYLYKKFLLHSALKKLKQIEKSDRPDQLYYLFMQVIYEGNLNIDEILIDEVVSNRSWKDFFVDIEAETFDKKSNGDRIVKQKQLYEDAYVWLECFRKKI